MIKSFSSKKENKYHWLEKNGVSFKGYIYQNNNIKNEEYAISIFSNISGWFSFKEKLRKIIGFYAVIVENDEFIYAAVDRVNSTPLMYSVDTEFVIGDDISSFHGRGKTEIDSQSMEQYLASGYVYGKKTLMIGVYQLQPGSALLYDKKKNIIKTEAYYEYVPNQNVILHDSNDRYLHCLDNIHYKVFKRLANNLRGRKAIVPLSGGYDSRLILEMLLRVGYKNILCVTWGRENDWQTVIAQDVTSKLGVRWIRFNQSYKSWNKWYKCGGLKKQLEYCGAFCSIPYIQENILIDYLREAGELTEDPVFINGNSGDFIEGEHLPCGLSSELNDEEIIHIIKKKHLRLAKLRDYAEIDYYLAAQVSDFRKRNIDIRYFFEYWEWMERQSKFVTNCIKPFESNGYEWRMPLWENEIMDFWVNVPIHIKEKRSLYFDYFKKYMNSDLLPPNGKVSYPRIIYERLADQRFGIFFDNLFGFERLMSTSSKRYENIFRDYNVIEKESLLKAKLNSLVALDVVNYFIDIDSNKRAI